MSRNLMNQVRPKFACLRIHGPDQKGILHEASQVLDKFGCAISRSEQFTDPKLNHYYQRSLFHPSAQAQGTKDDTGFHIEEKLEIEDIMSTLKQNFGLEMMKINWRDRPKRMAVFVSKYDHCLWEILLRHEAKDLDCEITAVLSNHPDLRPIVEAFGIPFKVYTINPENKKIQEKEEIALLKDDLNVDMIVLARYMQVLTNEFLDSFQHDQIINIHHSFLPAFMGGNPYRRAYERGVKLIGATAHYVTENLDEGPIIDQDVIRVSHVHGPDDLVRKGKIIERNVLMNAIDAHLADRIIAHKNKCVVFNE